MNVRAFADTLRREIEIFMEEVESGRYLPLLGTGTDLDTLTKYEWEELFRTWRAKGSPSIKSL